MTVDRTTQAFQPESLESLVGRVADEFLARQERGERPNVEEYAALYPHAAEHIRESLAALRLAGSFSRSQAVQSGSAEFSLPEALGDFRIVREIGRGGMGIVYEAEQLSLRRKVALKVLPFAAVMDPRQLQRFRNEALAAASLDHPHAVRIYAVGSDRGVHYIAMQYIDGRSLAEVIRERCGEATGKGASPPKVEGQTRTYSPDVTAETPASKSPPPTAGTTPRTPTDATYARRVAKWGIHAAEALEHAHALGIVQRDVKPANLLVDGRGELFVVDFGLAKLGPDPSGTGTGDLLGTPRYMSPEQACAKHGLVDHRSDVYSLGASMYELLTLEPAFAGHDRATILRRIAEDDPTPPRKLARKVPRDLETVWPVANVLQHRHNENPEKAREKPLFCNSRLVAEHLRRAILLKCLDKDPERRYQSAQALADDLGRFLADKPVQAKRRTLQNRVGRWMRKHPGTIAGMAAAVLVGLMGLGAALYFVNAEKGRTHKALDAAVDAREKEKLARDQETLALEHAEKAATDEKAANSKAQKRLSQIEKGNKLLGAIFDDLNIRKIEENGEKLDIVLGKRLKTAAAQLQAEEIGDPLVVAELQNTLGVSLLGFAHYDTLGRVRPALCW